MKTTMMRSLFLLGVGLALQFSVAAQDVPKVKTDDKETKYKAEDLKVKDKKDELKLKSEELKLKAKKDEGKLKGKVRPMQVSTIELTEMKTGETEVRTKEHVTPLATEQTKEATVTPPVAVQKTFHTSKKMTVRKSTARKTSVRKPVVASKPATGVKYVVKTKVVRDTVYVPSAPERVVSTQTEYVHDTVFVTRVDTVVRTQTANTYSGYNVPRGDFKKVKLKKDKNDEVYMKVKEERKMDDDKGVKRKVKLD